MTRETKAGLVVSCSFLCLVGVVLYCKLNGPKPPLADAYAEGVEAPPAPTAVNENNHPDDVVLPFGSDNTSSPSEKLAIATTESGSKTSGFGNNDVPSPRAKIANDGPTVSDPPSNGDLAANSASKTETTSQDKKNASASSTSIYALPDPVGDDKDAASANSTKSTGSENKITKAGATLDPIQDVKEAKDAGDKGLQDASKASWVLPPDESGKEKNSDVAKNASIKADGGATSVDRSSNGDEKNTADTSSLGGDRRSSESKTLSEQEPPPIPKGLHDPFQSLPETPAPPSSLPATANRSPRDAGLRKPTTNPVGAANGKGTSSGQGITGITASPGRGDPSSSSGTVTQASTSSPSNGLVGENSKNSVAMNSGTGRSLTPGVMPSPRTLSLPPAGDTAPEPNVRLGPPTGSPLSPQPGQNSPSSAADAASSLPPANQMAQGPAPNISGPGNVPPYQTPGIASGSITGPARTPAAQVDSYDEETYLCKAGDTFAAISTKFYLTEKYSQALLLFNRNHPRAMAGVRQDPPSLAAGQPVYIPPLRVLEKRYATAISDQGSGVRGQESGAPVAPAAESNPDAGISALPSAPKEIPGSTGAPNYTIPDVRTPALPSPAPGVNPAKTPVLSGQTRVPGPTERSYVVPKNGETFWEISRHTLGNPNRWSEISRLNPQIDPKYPVPGSMTLRMPADARIDPPTPAPAENR